MTSSDQFPEKLPLPAFPGAEGYGAQTPGGRGGSVYEVTNLNDDGPGSLRDAVSAPNRTVIFRVSGTIQLKSQLLLTHPYITLAGQTAPGDGICTRDYDVCIATHDVIVRYMRFRLGDVTKTQEDSFTIGNGSSHVIVDHCSASWSVDEVLSMPGNVSNVTVQWCLIAEGLNDSCHAKGPHGYGSLARANGPITFHHNLWAHHDMRNPRMGDNYNRPPYPFFDFRNNVVYDYGQICSGWTQGTFSVNYIANYIRPGPSSSKQPPIYVTPESKLTFYVRDNILEGDEKLTADNLLFVDPVIINGKRQVHFSDAPFDSVPVKTSSAREAYEAVLSDVGATLPMRDSVDRRIIQEVLDRQGTIIDSQTQVGSWPELKSAPAPIDSNHNGIPDDWEIRHGLNPHQASDRNADSNHDGYTNLEDYLNGTDPRKTVDFRDPINNRNTLKRA
jgi:hypothetical protein